LTVDKLKPFRCWLSAAGGAAGTGGLLVLLEGDLALCRRLCRRRWRLARIVANDDFSTLHVERWFGARRGAGLGQGA